MYYGRGRTVGRTGGHNCNTALDIPAKWPITGDMKIKKYYMYFVKSQIVAKGRLNVGSAGFWNDCVHTDTGELTMDGKPHGFYQLTAAPTKPDVVIKCVRTAAEFVVLGGLSSCVQTSVRNTSGRRANARTDGRAGEQATNGKE